MYFIAPNPWLLHAFSAILIPKDPEAIVTLNAIISAVSLTCNHLWTCVRTQMTNSGLVSCAEGRFGWCKAYSARSKLPFTRWGLLGSD